jgi:hypothetical protein
MDDYKNDQIAFNKGVMELDGCMRHCESLRQILSRLERKLKASEKALLDFTEKENKK